MLWVWFLCFFFYLIFYNFCHAEMLLKIKGKQDLKQKKKQQNSLHPMKRYKYRGFLTMYNPSQNSDSWLVRAYQ